MRRRWTGRAAVVLLAVVAVAGCTTTGGRGASGASTAVSGSSSTAPSSTAPTSVQPTSAQPTSRPPTSRPPTSRPPTTTPPSPGLPARLRGRDWTVIPTTRHVVALTFDAGANDAGLASIFATLAREGVAATFFLTAEWATTYPAEAVRVCARFRVGNHSVTHPHFTQLSDAEIRSEVLGAAVTIRRVCGSDPRPLFRFPFGDRDARTITAVNDLGYVPVNWTVDTLGWQGTSEGISTRVVVSRVLAALRAGEIVLMHVGSHPTDHSTLDADALPEVIRQLRARGYGFVTLDALLA